MHLMKVLLFLSLFFNLTSLVAAEKDFTLDIQVRDQKKEAIEAAIVLVEPYGVWGITDQEGKIQIAKIPYNKATRYQVNVSILGYKAVTRELSPKAGAVNRMVVEMEEESMAMKEVVVVAENKKSGESTASKIGRQAIDHLQATSLNDLLQLIPGQVNMSNPSLDHPKYFSSRTLYNNPAGSSLVIDGIPLSTNSTFEENGGVDLRSIGTDDIQSVEIIRGIASAEYGDVSTGTMIVNSKIGITDLNVRSKIMPGIMQFYAGKGFKAGRFGNLNLSADYAHGKSDPRYTTDTYDRILASIAHNKQVFDGKWDLTTKINFTTTKDWSGADAAEPEALRKYFKQQDIYDLRINHSGRINLNKRFAGTIKYDLAYQNKTSNSYSEDLTTTGSGTIFDSTEDGIYEGTPYPRAYETITGINSNPISYYAKIADLFHLHAGSFLNRFNIGAEFRSEGNDGTGHYDKGPYPAFAQERKRRFCDIPYLTQFSVYGEDRFTLPFTSEPYPNLKGQLGFRWTMIQPGRSESMNSISPRINLSLNLTDWLSVRGGFGQAEKLPNLLQLYPDKVYYDFYNMAVYNGKDPYYLYSTRVFNLGNPDIKPMQNNKWEAGLDIKLHNGMSFSFVGFHETTRNGFGNDLSRWTALQFPVWSTDDIQFEGSKPVYDINKPSYYEDLLVNLPQPGNTWWERNSGLEFDLDFGKLRATNTAFYLNGAYTHSESSSKNQAYRRPIGETKSYTNVYVVYPEGTGNQTEKRRFSSALRIVQHIPVIKFVVTATAQFIFYDYDHTLYEGEKPIGYITDDHHKENWTNGRGEVHYTAFTPEQFTDPDFEFEGFLLRDQVYERLVSNLPTIWPFIWSMNLRVTKEISNVMGFSFYVNNMLFHQPWQTTNTSPNPIERNASLFSYGLELFLHF